MGKEIQIIQDKDGEIYILDKSNMKMYEFGIYPSRYDISRLLNELLNIED